MSGDRDLALALQLQAQFDEEAAVEISGASASGSSPSTTGTTAGPGGRGGGRGGHGPRTPDNSGRYSGPANSKEPMSIVDEKWELLDPNPDMRAMFLEFNDKYFWGRLAGVEVRWSPRMTLCAGLCCYEGRGGLCSIRLSSPLLKLRPRKDLVETLLHEMIHAYLFVTANNKDHDGHGPEFCKHMKRLNLSTGTNITIYHSFHDEVDLYRQHWWRCNGPCQKKPPYYGMVRRAMNRAPSPRDPWWAEHQRSCGGSYTKVKEPEGYGAKKGTKRKKGESEEDSSHGSENEAKKQATNVPSLFPGKGMAIGGAGTASRLVQSKAVTLDKFLRKIEGSKESPSSSTPPHPAPTTSRVPIIGEEAEPGQKDRSRNSRLKALAAIFDSDDEDDEDIVIVKFGNPLKKSIGRQGDDNDDQRKNMPGTSQSNSQHPTKKSGDHSRRNSPAAGPASTSKPSPQSNSQHPTKNPGDHSRRTSPPIGPASTSKPSPQSNIQHPTKNPGDLSRRSTPSAGPASTSKPSPQSNSQHPTKNSGDHSQRTFPPMGPASTSKPSQSGVDTLSKHSGTNPSHQSNRDDRGKKQDSIIDAFSRMRQRSGEHGAGGGPRPGTLGNQRTNHESQAQDRNISQPSRRDGSASGAIVIDGELPSDVGTVECPVCTLKLNQSQINQHLDQCLA